MALVVIFDYIENSKEVRLFVTLFSQNQVKKASRVYITYITTALSLSDPKVYY